jgi:hypothetical protein
MCNTMQIDQRAQAIVIAHNHGVPFRTIGKIHGITGTRVQQIYRKAIRAAKPRTVADELSTRVRNALQAEGCLVTPAAVAARFDLAALRQVQNIGVGSIAELNEWLVRHGEKPL